MIVQDNQNTEISVASINLLQELVDVDILHESLYETDKERNDIVYTSCQYLKRDSIGASH